MSDLREAAQQALEAWQTSSYGQPSHQKAMVLAMTALRAALAEPVQEPVAWIESPHGAIRANPNYKFTFPSQLLHWQIPLYTAPRQGKPLTEEEIDAATSQERDALLDHIYEYGTAAEGVLERIRKLARATERAHGIGGQDD